LFNDRASRTIVDAEGNAVSLTNTLGLGFGTVTKLTHAWHVGVIESMRQLCLSRFVVLEGAKRLKDLHLS